MDRTNEVLRLIYLADCLKMSEPEDLARFNAAVLENDFKTLASQFDHDMITEIMFVELARNIGQARIDRLAGN